MIHQRVAQFIGSERLFSVNNKVLVTLSGGADSVALLRILLSLGYQCEAAHCNFHLREKESDRDEEFARVLCKKLNIPFHVTHFETKAYAIQKKISIEMAARELRYEWFEKIRKKIQADVIAVAHHKDDSAETILLNLIRGTGLNGLLGISPCNERIVRPLLCINREEIISYLHQLGQNYITDSTNLLDEYTRNKIRLNLLPLMEEINPSVKDSIIAVGNRLSEVALLYNKGIEDGKRRVIKDNSIHIDLLLQEPSSQSLLFEILYPLGFNSAQIKDILHVLEGQAGKSFISKKGWRVIKDRKKLLIEREGEESTPSFELTRTDEAYTQAFVIPREKEIACFDADKLQGKISIRKWKKGDTFVPFGMKGTKLVSDFLTDHKLSLNQKENQWVLCCNEQIAWIIGQRTDNRFRIDEHTHQITLFRLTNRHNE